MSLVYFQRMARRTPRFIGLNLQLNRNWPFIEELFMAGHDHKVLVFMHCLRVNLCNKVRYFRYQMNISGAFRANVLELCE